MGTVIIPPMLQLLAWQKQSIEQRDMRETLLPPSDLIKSGAR